MNNQSMSQLIFSVIVYPPITIHILSKIRISTQNKILNWALKQKYSDTSSLRIFSNEKPYIKYEFKPINQNLPQKTNNL